MATIAKGGKMRIDTFLNPALSSAEAYALMNIFHYYADECAPDRIAEVTERNNTIRMLLETGVSIVCRLGDEPFFELNGEHFDNYTGALQCQLSKFPQPTT